MASSRLIVPAEYNSGAWFSDCKKYRYSLYRHWEKMPICANFVMLNPSTADENVNDPTVQKCQEWAKEWGYGGVVITNIFAFRATDPREMRAVEDPVGLDNDYTIQCIAHYAGIVICGWGNHGLHRDRSAQVRKLLAGVPLYYLRMNGTGEPCHPLYLPKSSKPIRWEI